MSFGGAGRFGLLLADARGRAVLFVAAAALAFGAGGAVAAANAAASQVTADWTQWAFNARHTGYNSHETALNTSAVATLKPVFATSLVTQPDPIVVNGKVYLSNNISGFVQAVDATTGAKLWTRGACVPGEETSDPAFAGGSVWVGLADPGLAGVGAGGTGVKCVQKGDLYPTPPSAAGGTVYAGGQDGVATAVDAVTGQVRWIQQVAPAPAAVLLYSPAVSPDGRFLFIGSANGTVYKLNAGTGRVLWSRFIDTCASSAVSVTASLVYVGGCNLYALSPSTGRVVWRTSRFGPEVTTPTIVGDKVIAATATGTFGAYTGAAAFNATTGRLLWRNGDERATVNPFPGGGPVPLTAADGVVYVDEGSDVDALDSSNGTFIKTLFPPSGSSFSGSVVPAEGRVYVCIVASSTGVATLAAYQPDR